MTFTWSFLAFYDILGPGKYSFSRSGHNLPCNILIKLHVGCKMLDKRPKLSEKKTEF